jgi:hypothetical protein
VWDEVATDRVLVTNEMADFGTHAEKRSSGLAGGLCDTLDESEVSAGAPNGPEVTLASVD